MKNLSIALVALALPIMAHAQTKADNERAMQQFKQLYNNDQADSIRDMFSDMWGKMKSGLWSADQQKDLKKHYGKLISFQYMGIDSVSDANKVALFKTHFEKSTHVTGLVLDKDHVVKIETFRFETSSEYINSTYGKHGEKYHN